MRIVSLQASNIKRLQAVDITPTGALVEITGSNGNGKTSLLDSIWWGLAGKGAMKDQSQPIRRGEETAEITLDLGTLIVRRRFNAQEDGGYTTSVVVESTEGARFNKPQDVLNSLVGKLTFDPLDAFLNEKPADQVKILQSFVKGVDFAVHAGKDAKDVEARRDANREVEKLKAQIAGIKVPEIAPEPVDEQAILDAMRDASATNQQLQATQRERDREVEAIRGLQAEANQAYDRATKLRQEADDLDLIGDKRAAEANTRAVAYKTLEPLPAPVDTADLAQQLQAAQGIRSTLAEINRRAALETEMAKQKATADAADAAIKARAAERAKAVAEAKIPVPGLAFDGEEVTLNGLPFTQASDAEQLRASIAIAAAMNPKLRIARIRDGSRLDRAAMAMLAQFAEEHDLQVWLESVESSRPSAIVIEDGRVARAPMLQAAE